LTLSFFKDSEPEIHLIRTLTKAKRGLTLSRIFQGLKIVSEFEIFLFYPSCELKVQTANS